MLYRYNTDIQSLRAGFFKRGGNIIALAKKGKYSKYYSRYRAYMTLI